MKAGDFFTQYNRLIILAVMLTVLLAAALLGSPVAAEGPCPSGGYVPI